MEKGTDLTVTKEIAIEGSISTQLMFSSNGEYLAINRKTEHILDIYEIDNQDILGLFDKVQNN